MNTIKLFLRNLRTAQVMRRLDKQFFRMEVSAINAARSIEAYRRVTEAIDDGSMS